MCPLCSPEWSLPGTHKLRLLRVHKVSHVNENRSREIRGTRGMTPKNHTTKEALFDKTRKSRPKRSGLVDPRRIGKKDVICDVCGNYAVSVSIIEQIFLEIK